MHYYVKTAILEAICLPVADRTPTRTRQDARICTQGQGAQDTIQPLDQDEALSLYESLSEKRVEAEEAFPGVKIEEA